LLSLVALDLKDQSTVKKVVISSPHFVGGVVLGEYLHDGPLVDPPNPLPTAISEVGLVLQNFNTLKL